jgi:hypothetical protein
LEAWYLIQNTCKLQVRLFLQPKLESVVWMASEHTNFTFGLHQNRCKIKHTSTGLENKTITIGQRPRAHTARHFSAMANDKLGDRPWRWRGQLKRPSGCAGRSPPSQRSALLIPGPISIASLVVSPMVIADLRSVFILISSQVATTNQMQRNGYAKNPSCQSSTSALHTLRVLW